MVEQKELYCPKCQKSPTKIIERYLEPVEEIRVWDGVCFVLIESNLDSVEYEQLCVECKGKLDLA